jgi:hypothetical protein
MKSRTAVFAIVALVLIATASAVLTVRMTARAIDDTASVQTAEAPEIARLYVAKYGDLEHAAPSIVKRVSRSGLHVTLIDFKSGVWYSERGTIRRSRRPEHHRRRWSARRPRRSAPFGLGRRRRRDANR